MISWRVRPIQGGSILEIYDGMTGVTLALMFNNLDGLEDLLYDMLEGVRNARVRQTTRLEDMSAFVREFPERF